MTTPDRPERIGVVGVGKMGAAIATRLKLTGGLVGVCDSDPEVAARLAEELSVGAASARELAAKVDILVTVLPTSAIVAEVLFGAGAVAAALAPGALVLDMTSGVPATTRDLAVRLAGRHIAMVDAPVSGGVARGWAGELTIMAGGADDAVDRIRPVLAPVGNTFFHVGAIGAGQAMKALNNLASAGGMLIAVEAVNVARQFGIDPQRAIDALNASSGMNNATLRKFKQFILSEAYDSGFAMQLMVKDVVTAVDLAHQLGIHTPFADDCLAIWKKAAAALPADADHTLIAGGPYPAAGND